MSGPSSAKELLKASNQNRYNSFITNNIETALDLPTDSSVPWIAASKRKDTYLKTIHYCDKESSHNVKFIKKNGKHHSQLWETSPENLKIGVRWGIVKTNSITSKVTGALGHYRVYAHQRIAKGMESNSQRVKLKLLDFYQERLEALEKIESLVNNNNTAETYDQCFKHYIRELEGLKTSLDGEFIGIPLDGLLKEEVFKQIKRDLDADIARARQYLSSLTNSSDLRANNRARGQNSILEFVKQQMLHQLYTLQGINQDMTYSLGRRFALTRGKFDEVIVDALIVMDNHTADPRNAVEAEHHGVFNSDTPNQLISYDFSNDDLSPAAERDALLAISFIEGCDSVEYVNKKPYVKNGDKKEPLDTIYATRWQTHRNGWAFLKSSFYFVLNIFKSFFVSTHPWEEEVWSNKDFHLKSSTLRKLAKPNYPMWHKPVAIFKQIFYAMRDIGSGIRALGREMVVEMPVEILTDWKSTSDMVTLDETLKAVLEEINAIATIEKSRLDHILNQCAPLPQEPPPSLSELTSVPYPLTSGDHNDILTAAAHGFYAFGSVFSEVYAKDPLAGLAFSSACALGFGAIYAPMATSSLMGANYVKSFTQFAYTIGSSKLTAALSGGTAQGQILNMAWDTLMHGPSGLTANALYRFGEDPLTISTYLALAYSLGYLLANGVAGHPIPWVSDHMKSELGNVPEASYPLIGGKIAIMLYKGLQGEPNPLPTLSNGPLPTWRQIDPMADKDIQRFYFLSWLFTHRKAVQKLGLMRKFELSRQIESHFSKDESRSLKKLLYPELKRSIAFQLFGIPLTYIPLVLRCVISVVLTLVAWAKKKPHPLEPMKRAWTALAERAAKDLSRLIVCLNFLLYSAYTLVTTHVKMIAFVLAMLIGRIAAIFGARPGHAIHSAFAAVNGLFRKMAEFLYPARALKHVEVADPVHTLLQNTETFLKNQGSYAKMTNSLRKSEETNDQDQQVDTTNQPKTADSTQQENWQPGCFSRRELAKTITELFELKPSSAMM